MKKPAKLPLRIIVQTLFLCWVFLLIRGRSMGIQFFEQLSIHTICPFGGVVSFYQFVTTGTLVRRVHESALVLMFTVFALAVFFGPVFCGWLCPFGTVQEFFGKIGRKIFGKRYNAMLEKTRLGSKLDTTLRFLRYFILALVIFNTARSGHLVFADYDPYFALFNMFTNEVAVTAYIILGIVLALSLIMERPFCKYACPYGALLGLFNFFSVFRISRKEESCTKCRLCDKCCPMNIKISEKQFVRNHQCISCMECTSEKACPIINTVYLAAVKPGRRTS